MKILSEWKKKAFTIVESLNCKLLLANFIYEHFESPYLLLQIIQNSGLE